MLKNKVIIILLALVLVSPVFAEEPSLENTENMPVTETVAPEVSTSTPEPEIEQQNYAYKQPVSRRKIAKKFLLAMAGVGISSILLFALLSLYNKIRGGVSNQQTTPEGETSLVTPYSLEEAVRTFLDKTKY